MKYFTEGLKVLTMLEEAVPGFRFAGCKAEVVMFVAAAAKWLAVSAVKGRRLSPRSP